MVKTLSFWNYDNPTLDAFKKVVRSFHAPCKGDIVCFFFQKYPFLVYFIPFCVATKKIVFYKLSGILPVPFYFQIRDYFSNWNVLDPKSLTYGVELMQEWKQLLEFRVNDPNSAHIFKNNEAKSFGRLFSWNDFFPRIRFSTSSLKIVEERTARPRGSSWVVFFL